MNNIAVGYNIIHADPICEKCKKFDARNITLVDDLTYCFPCIVILIRNAEETIQKNKSLEERLNKLENFVQEVWSYTPGNPGYEETKEHFESIAKPES